MEDIFHIYHILGLFILKNNKFLKPNLKNIGFFQKARSIVFSKLCTLSSTFDNFE